MSETKEDAKEDMRDVEETSPDETYVKFGKKKLGYGAFKDVYLCCDTKNMLDRAWNVVDLSKIKNEDDKKQIEEEKSTLQKLNHPNIIKVYANWTKKNQLIFITDWVTSGSLRDYMTRMKTTVKLRVLKRWCKQILDGLHYLHSQRPPVIHRDIKCDNIFIDGQSGKLRIGDFGLAINRHQTTMADGGHGTPEFMAPELINGDYNELVDVWAFGMLVLEILLAPTKGAPFPYSECHSMASIVLKIVQGAHPDVIHRVKSRQLRSFLKLCLAPKERRLSAADLLQHPFLQYSDPLDDAKTELLEGPADEHVISEKPSILVGPALSLPVGPALSLPVGPHVGNQDANSSSATPIANEAGNSCAGIPDSSPPPNDPPMMKEHSGQTFPARQQGELENDPYKSWEPMLEKQNSSGKPEGVPTAVATPGCVPVPGTMATEPISGGLSATGSIPGGVPAVGTGSVPGGPSIPVGSIVQDTPLPKASEGSQNTEPTFQPTLPKITVQPVKTDGTAPLYSVKLSFLMPNNKVKDIKFELSDEDDVNTIVNEIFSNLNWKVDGTFVQCVAETMASAVKTQKESMTPSNVIGPHEATEHQNEPDPFDKWTVKELKKFLIQSKLTPEEEDERKKCFDDTDLRAFAKTVRTRLGEPLARELGAQIRPISRSSSHDYGLDEMKNSTQDNPPA
mmetsp:Transcript_17794/g.25015  ORF Transcript_17794/g.25015 Transcript_17794/m.25015 type:complete len:679 (+) Transcript_17794:59-2095(+)